MKREIFIVELVRFPHSSGYTARITLSCGHVLYRKASDYRGKTATCRECATRSQ